MMLNCYNVWIKIQCFANLEENNVRMSNLRCWHGNCSISMPLILWLLFCSNHKYDGEDITSLSWAPCIQTQRISELRLSDSCWRPSCSSFYQAGIYFFNRKAIEQVKGLHCWGTNSNYMRWRVVSTYRAKFSLAVPESSRRSFMPEE